jgi:hypothetical protein
MAIMENLQLLAIKVTVGRNGTRARDTQLAAKADDSSTPPGVIFSDKPLVHRCLQFLQISEPCTIPRFHRHPHLL